MRIIQIILFFLLLSMTSLAESQVDSLQRLLDQATSSLDIIDYNLGLARINMLAEGDSKKGLEHAHNAFEEAERISSLKYQAIAQIFIGMLEFNISQPYQESIKKAMELSEKSEDPRAIAFAYYVYTEALEFDFEAGINRLEGVIEKYGPRLDKRLLGNVYKVLSWQYEQNGELEEAERANLKSIEILTEFAENIPIDPALNRPSALNFDGGLENLFQVIIYTGDLYIKMGRSEDAVEMGRRAEKLANRLNNNSTNAYLYDKQADYYKSVGDYENAIQKYSDAIAVYEQMNDVTFLAKCLSSQADLYIVLEEYNLAERVLTLAIQFSKEVPNDQADYMNQYAFLLKKNGDVQKAIEILLDTEKIYAQTGNRVRELQSKYQIAEIKFQSGILDGLEEGINSQISELEEFKEYKLIYNYNYLLSNIAESKGNLQASLGYAQKAFQTIDENTIDLERKELSLRKMSSLSEMLGEYQNSLEYLKGAENIQDSLYSEVTTEIVKSQQVKQNVDEYKAAKVAAEERTKLLQRQNIMAILAAITLLGLLLVGAYFYTQLRKTRIQLESQNIELQSLNATKDRFFGIIAHDIRSPIVALESVDRQMAYYMDRGDGSKAKKLSTLVGSTARNLSRLLDNLLNWALVQTDKLPFNPEKINLADTVNESIELFRANFSQKQINLDNQIKEIYVFADPKAVSTIVRNLLSNAIKFTPDKGKIILNSSIGQEKVVIEINDSGVGMDDSVVKELFDLKKKSKTGTAGEKGTGLGLILVKELTELHGGTLELESTPGVGSKFWFSLSLAD